MRKKVNRLHAALYGFIALAVAGEVAAIGPTLTARPATRLYAAVADASGAKGLPGDNAHAFKWVDATGAAVGLAAPYSQTVLLTIDGQRYAVPVFRWGDFSAQLKGHWNLAQPGHNEAVRFYESEDCSGRPYYDSSPELGATAPAVMDWHADGSTDIITLDPEAHVVQLKCYRTGNGDMHLYPDPYWTQLYSAKNVYSLDLMFPAPLSFQ